jgi:Domain of unknown function (DUF4166)
MNSIYQKALGVNFQRLHPKIQERFGFSSLDGVACFGQGIMDEVWHGRFYTLPFLYLGTWRRIMFPEKGKNVPFTLENYAFVDNFGRETVTWIRRFQIGKARRFDAYMIYSEQRKRIIDYLGTHQHLPVDIDLSIAENGGLKLRSGTQRFYEGPIAISFPMFFSGIADVCEWYDDATQKYRIEVNVHNRTWGRIFGYRGSFNIEWRKVTTDEIPDDIRPMRLERRE